MNIKISSDSTCDLPRELISKYNITLMPLTIIKGGHNFSDGIDITPADVFAYASETGDLCSTGAINIGEYRALFQTLCEQYDAVVHICIGSNFSCCYQNACLAAEEFPNVYIVDSQNLSAGHGHIVMEACKMAQDATDAATMCAELSEFAERVESSFLLERLDYMAKGGRCSSVIALGANLMKLKPCISVVNGKMVVGKKYRGSYAKCLAAYIKDRLAERDDILWDTLFFTYTSVSDDAMASAREAVAQYGGRFEHAFDAIAGCSISCHCGPGTLGIMFVRKKI